MGLLDKLTQQGSTLTNLDGATPQGFNPQTVLNPASFVGSNLDLDGFTPVGYNVGPNNSPILANGLVNSTLDLNGTTPEQYVNNLPG